jgi:hypothetical protein
MSPAWNIIAAVCWLGFGGTWLVRSALTAARRFRVGLLLFFLSPVWIRYSILLIIPR